MANKILTRMLERLFAGLVSGPNLNCRPHSSRQRVDFSLLAKLQDLSPEEVLGQLLGAEKKAKLSAQATVPAIPKKGTNKKPARTDENEKAEAAKEEETLTPEEKAIQEAWSAQQAVLSKLRILADEARTYKQDTGVHVLNIGFPLLSLPPGSPGLGSNRGGGSKRILAPIAFIPVEISIRSGPSPTVDIACQQDEVDAIVPNTALFSWLEQHTGQAFDESPPEQQPGSGMDAITRMVEQAARMLKLEVPEPFAGREQGQSAEAVGSSSATADCQLPLERKPWKFRAAPRSDDEESRPAILAAAVLGLFPLNNQGLLRDTQAMLAEEKLDGPVESFLQANVSLEQAAPLSYEHESWSGPKRPRVFSEERAVTHSDPCQARAVRLARACRGLVIHGPPGTGKSQTITNIIGDHLARGERVLMVCDKRTALDVVANRLEHLGLGGLFAVVHDPRHDQHHLYRKLRDQLENLTDARSDPWAEPKLDKIDAELHRLHAELSETWSWLMAKDATGTSFHELAGSWLETPGPTEIPIDVRTLGKASLAELEQHNLDVDNLLTRGAAVGYAGHPWKTAAGMRLEVFLNRPMAEIRSSVSQCLELGQAADVAAEGSIPFAAKPSVQEQGEARLQLARELDEALSGGLSLGVLGRWAGQNADAVRRAQAKLTAAQAYLHLVRQGPLDAELALQVASESVSVTDLSSRLGKLESYLAVASEWYGLFCFKRRSQANEVLGKFGLSPGPASARRLREFFLGLRARMVLQALHQELTGQGDKKPGMMEDEVLTGTLSALGKLLHVLDKVRHEPALAGLAKPLTDMLAEPSKKDKFLDGLKRSSAWADCLIRLQHALEGSGLFCADWLTKALERWRNSQPCTKELAPLHKDLDTLEGVLRIRQGLESLPDWLKRSLETLCGRSEDAALGMATLRKMVLGAELTTRLQANAKLQALDPQRLHTAFERFRALEQEKLVVVRDTILHRWIGRQKERLLVGTGSRLNGAGADLRRRLTMRGEQALRLRQVISVGQGIDGGDPLFDLCPVWLASPETVAQVFPRMPLFDVAIFDEASQCRLEEALPVLLRGRRLVIAGDPKQLPPTRFFESALAASTEEEIESDQQLFEVHQAEIEDLLGAALSIDIQQCYLDVHYRSWNADLIEFSNQQFYSSRLQPIPGHPSHRARFAPITLYRAEGVYEERANIIEAKYVCRIVRDLLKRAEPPSIGIACFNLTQRDRIAEELDELAQADREFASHLSEARTRQGAGSFEGLFVKNLENVQGDERDHIIISTTYGPDPAGRFYKRFGPLGRAGGGRRLNVLVTRARQEVHLVTSIPPGVYRGVPPVPPGQTPGGAWLLFSYLAYAEYLAEAYEKAHQALAESAQARQATVNVRPSQVPSAFATALGRRLAQEHAIGGTVHWGNDGFCVDLALEHPRRPDDVTVGILCDGVRFAQAEDPMEWDLFRTAILEGQGWRLHRLWTPHFFRDPQGGTQQILRDVDGLLALEKNTVHDQV